MISPIPTKWQARQESELEEGSLPEHFLHARGKTLNDFIRPNFSDLADPFLFRDMERATRRIFDAIENKERILIFGDYDLDGMSSVAQLFQTLRHLGAEVSYRLPCRSDGYGLSSSFVQEAVGKNVRLLITTDCGISNDEQVQYANEHGMDTIITDHHSIPEKIPPAYAILHPLMPQETFPDPHLTGAGVAFFLSYALISMRVGNDHAMQFASQLLEMAVLGTIADCGALTGQNRVITLLGIEAMKQTQNPGLLALLELAGIEREAITAEQIAFFLAPRLNASGRLAHPTLSLEALLGNTSRAAELERLNTRRKNLVSELMNTAEEILGPSRSLFPYLLVKHPEFLSGVVGLIAGKLAEKYGVPAIAIEESEDKLTASCRGPDDFHFAKTLKSMKAEDPELFLGCGGHAAAAGFSLIPEKYDQFCQQFSQIVIRERGTIPPKKTLWHDGTIDRAVSPEEILALSECEPFGTGNMAPRFLLPSFRVEKIRAVGNDQRHMSLFVRSAHQSFSAIWFGAGELVSSVRTGEMVDILATPEVQEWRGKQRLQLKIVDMRRHQA